MTCCTSCCWLLSIIDFSSSYKQHKVSSLDYCFYFVVYQVSIIANFHVKPLQYCLFRMFSFNFDRYMQDASFNATYRCYSVSMLPDERQNLEKGGKIIMPPSALYTLTRLNTTYPMLFKLTNTEKNRHTHCGVLEFVAEEGKVYLPYWMMRNLLLDEGCMLQVKNVSLPVATFSKFQPQSVDFLDISNPKAVLENGLRNFACLTSGDVIAINYNNKIYELCVLETKPGDAVSIIECDMNVDFEAPIGYEEPKRQAKQFPDNQSDNETEDDVSMLDELLSHTMVPFSGQGNRLDGKTPKPNQVDELKNSCQREYRRGIPDYNYQLGTIKFCRKFRNQTTSSSGQTVKASKP